LKVISYIAAIHIPPGDVPKAHIHIYTVHWPLIHQNQSPLVRSMAALSYYNTYFFGSLVPRPTVSRLDGLSFPLSPLFSFSFFSDVSYMRSPFLALNNTVEDFSIFCPIQECSKGTILTKFINTKFTYIKHIHTRDTFHLLKSPLDW
jgi:hypothetical protein